MTQDNSTAQLVGRLRRQARTRSDIQRTIAQAKSLRQEDHDPPRDDLYMWSAPAQTIEWQAADLIERLTRPQPSTRSIEAVARAICKAMGDHWFGSAAYERYNERWKKVAVDVLAALPSPEREPMREALANARAYVALGSIYARKLGEMEVVREAGEMLAEIDALLAPPPAQSGDRT